MSYFYGKSIVHVPTPVQTNFSDTTYTGIGGGTNTNYEWVTGCSGSNLTRSNVSTFNNIGTYTRNRDTFYYHPDLILQAKAGDTITFSVNIGTQYSDHEAVRAWINLGSGYYQIGNTLDTYGGNTLTFDYTIPVGTPAGNYALCGMNDYYSDYQYGNNTYRSVNYYSLHIFN